MQGFGEVLAAHGWAGGEVGDAARDFEDALVAAHGEVHTFGGAVEERQYVRFGVQVAFQQAAVKGGVGPSLTFELDAARGGALGAQVGAGFGMGLLLFA